MAAAADGLESVRGSIEGRDQRFLKVMENHPEGHECRMCREVRRWLAVKAKERWWETVVH